MQPKTKRKIVSCYKKKVLRYLLLVYDFLNDENQEEGDIDQAVSKLNSKLISELAKRHSKLAKNVLESHEDRIER